MTHDVIVVGGGIVGMAVARALATGERPLSVAVLEREDEVGRHQTAHNSGVIHAGVYYAPGSLKARLCVEGARRMYEFCDEHGVPYRRCGKLIVAKDASELAALDELERRATTNGVPGLRRLGRERDRRGGAALRRRGGAALAPHRHRGLRAGGARHGRRPARGGRQRDHRRRRRRRSGPRRTASPCATRRGQARARFLVSCAGLWSDRVAVLAGADPDPRIVPFRGAYLRLAARKRDLVKGLIYPVPDPSLPFLGVHLTPHMDGEVSLGPTALLAPRARLAGVAGHVADARALVAHGLTELRNAVDTRAFARAAAEYVPALEAVRLLALLRGLPRPGAGPGRRAGGRLRDPRDRPRAACAQRAVARGHVVAGHRRPDRRPRPGGAGRVACDG